MIPCLVLNAGVVHAPVPDPERIEAANHRNQDHLSDRNACGERVPLSGQYHTKAIVHSTAKRRHVRCCGCHRNKGKKKAVEDDSIQVQLRTEEIM